MINDSNSQWHCLYVTLTQYLVDNFSQSMYDRHTRTQTNTQTDRNVQTEVFKRFRFLLGAGFEATFFVEKKQFLVLVGCCCIKPFPLLFYEDIAWVWSISFFVIFTLKFLVFFVKKKKLLCLLFSSRFFGNAVSSIVSCSVFFHRSLDINQQISVSVSLHVTIINNNFMSIS